MSQHRDTKSRFPPLTKETIDEVTAAINMKAELQERHTDKSTLTYIISGAAVGVLAAYDAHAYMPDAPRVVDYILTCAAGAVGFFAPAIIGGFLRNDSQRTH